MHVHEQTSGSNTLLFLYDDNGGRVGLQYNGANYLYVYNAQGDVIAIVDANHNVVVKYTYDEWGNKVSVTGSMASTLGVQNPFRYRGYCYDEETGWYYLQSRYYDPVTGRFLNADGQINDGVLGTNLFAYCENNPVHRYDPTGKVVITATICGIAVWKIGAIALAGVIAYVATDTLVKNPPVFPSISLPKIEAKQKVETKEKDIIIPDKQPKLGTTYYHVTTPEKAAAIIATRTMIGSPWEGGYVYAWKQKPSEYAAKNSGAHQGVIISFTTTTAYTIDQGISDPKILMYGPVVSLIPGPILVGDVQIVG